MRSEPSLPALFPLTCCLFTPRLSAGQEMLAKMRASGRPVTPYVSACGSRLRL